MSPQSGDKSQLKDFLASIATIKGDLSNITAPPFLLADKSVVEFPQYWAETPSLFLAPALEPEPQKRALLVLRWFLGSLKSQQCAGRKPEDGLKKPLNAFLGELFIGRWEDGQGTTRLISEQVSHHPPVTATVLWNEEIGIRVEGYTRQKITFSGSVSIKQIGHAIVTLQKYNESFYIPTPSVKVTGMLSGTPYPELQGVYKITSTSGFTSEIEFGGTSFFRSSNSKNTFTARLYQDDPDKPLYTVKGQWSDCFTAQEHSRFTVHDHSSGSDIETYDTATASVTPITVAPLDQQDPWESRNAWQHVMSAIDQGDMQSVSDEKGKIEQAQREMRKTEERTGQKWKNVFFKSVSKDDVIERLAAKAGEAPNVEETEGIWTVDWDVVGQKQKPFHPDWTPLGKVEEQSQQNGVTTDATSAHSDRDSKESDAESRRLDEDDGKARSNRQARDEDAALISARKENGAENEKEKGTIENMLRDKYSSAS